MFPTAFLCQVRAREGLRLGCCRYDPSANEWIPIAKMVHRRRGVAVVALHGKLYAIGGCAACCAPCGVA